VFIWRVCHDLSQVQVAPLLQPNWIRCFVEGEVPFVWLGALLLHYLIELLAALLPFKLLLSVKLELLPFSFQVLLPISFHLPFMFLLHH